MDSDLLRFQTDKKFLFFDFETYGLALDCGVKHSLNRAWQASFIEVKGKQEKEYDYLIRYKNDDYNISQGADITTGYSSRKVARYDYRTPQQQRMLHGIDFEDFFWKQKLLVDDCDYLIGHNILGFDIPIMLSMYNSMNIDSSEIIDKVIDTNCLARAVIGGINKPKSMNLLEFQAKVYNTKMKNVKSNLTAVGKRYNIEHDYENLHDSLLDIRLNIKIWNKLKYEIEI